MYNGIGGQPETHMGALYSRGGRAITLLYSTAADGAISRIVARFAEGEIVTIPRFWADTIVTEYGIADLWGKSDAEVISALLEIADSRFQDELVREAIAAKKLAADFKLPEAWKKNTPDAIDAALRPHLGYLPTYPFGTEMDEVEQDLALALEHLQDHTASFWQQAGYVAAAVASGPDAEPWRPHLQRLQLEKPSSLPERIWRVLVLKALEDTQTGPVPS